MNPNAGKPACRLASLVVVFPPQKIRVLVKMQQAILRVLFSLILIIRRETYVRAVRL